MCCIFTCCGWMLDLIQRCWIFFMSCCISSAVCCVVLTASTSGIALGYNYSLAEYIDLKETNVSVYIKRGVFDDDIADDMSWRRSGGGPEDGAGEAGANAGAGAGMGESDLRRSNKRQDDETTISSGRRLEDSLYEADNQNKYEGSLMRLTAKGHFHPSPPFIPTETTTDGPTPPSLLDIVSEFPPGSLNRLKAVQGVINARMAAQNTPQPDGRRNLGGQGPSRLDQQYKFLNDYPGFPGSRDESGRRSDSLKEGPPVPVYHGNPYRAAVPPPDIHAMPIGRTLNYAQPKQDKFEENPVDYDKPVTFPRVPPTVKGSRIRPPRPTPAKQRIVVADRQPLEQGITRTGLTRGTTKDSMFKDDLDKYKQRLLINQYDAANFKPEDFGRKRPSGDDYEEGFKGAPYRRKRSAQSIQQEQNVNPNDVNLNSTAVINNGSNPVLPNGINTIVDAIKTSATTGKPKSKYSIHSKTKKNAREKPRKRNRRQKKYKNKKLRKLRPTPKMRESRSSIHKTGEHQRVLQESTTVSNNIGQVTDGKSLFISKLKPVTDTKFVSYPEDLKKQKDTDFHDSFITSLNHLLFS